MVQYHSIIVLVRVRRIYRDTVVQAEGVESIAIPHGSRCIILGDSSSTRSPPSRLSHVAGCNHYHRVWPWGCLFLNLLTPRSSHIIRVDPVIYI